jgi:hypothetical protein
MPENEDTTRSGEDAAAAPTRPVAALYELPEDLVDMTDEEIDEFAIRVCADFRVAAKRSS